MAGLVFATAPDLRSNTLEGVPDFHSEAQPLIERYCYECHNSVDQKGQLDLEVLTRESDYLSNSNLLENLEWVLFDEAMPPREAPQPTEAERKLMLDWTNGSLARLQNARPNDPGVVVSPRINSNEYDFVIRSLTGHDLDAGKYLTADNPAGEGFMNVGAAQTLSVGQFEAFLGAAKSVLKHARVTPEKGAAFFSIPVPEAADEEDFTEGLRYLWEQSLEPHISDVASEQLEGIRAYWSPTQNFGQYANFQLIWATALEIAWQYRHRAALGMPNVTIDEIAANYGPGLIPSFGRKVEDFFRVATGGESQYGFMERFDGSILTPLLLDRFLQLPSPDKAEPEKVRQQIVELAEWINETFNHNDFSKNNRSELTIPLTKEEGGGTAFRGQMDRGIIPIKLDLTKSTTGEVYFAALELFDGPEGDVVEVSGLIFEDANGNQVPWEDAVSEFVDSEGNRFGFNETLQGHSPGENGIFVRGGTWVKFKIPDGMVRLTGRGVLAEDIGENSSVAWFQDDQAPENLIHLPGWKYVGYRVSEPANKLRSSIGEIRSLARDSQRFNGGTDFVTIPPNYRETLGIPQEQELFTSKGHFSGSFLDGSLPEVIERIGPESEVLSMNRDVFDLMIDYASSREMDDAQLRERAEDILRPFVDTAWRGQATDAEIERLMEIYDDETSNGALFETAVKQPLIASLVVPKFLYRFVESRNLAEPYPLQPRELATRLAFMLWSSLPDEELLSAAARGDLQTEEGMRRQVRRMIDDPRFDGFVAQFAAFWLHLAVYESKADPDAEKFEDFTPKVKAALYEEAERFLKYVFREDRPLAEILFADYTFLNDTVAKHYGLAEPEGDGFVKVSFDADDPRGGLLGMGAFHTLTSAPLRTSPVHRGIWVYEYLLGKPVPAPPPNVPLLSDTEVSEEGLTVAEQLAEHRNNPACFDCHDRFDPLGVALENFDPVGRWRTSISKDNPVDAKGVFGNGEVIDGITGLRRYLAEREEDFLSNFARKLIAYGSERPFMITDRPLQEEITRKLLAEDGNLMDALMIYLQSPQFQMRRDPPQVAAR